MSQKNHNSLDSILNDMAQTVSSVQLPNKITIINNAQAGGSNNNVQNNKSNYNVNKLLSMLATESATSSLNNTHQLENELRNMLELKGGKAPVNDNDELKAFIKKYNIKTLNGMESKQFLKKYNKSYGTGPSDDPSESSSNIITYNDKNPSEERPIENDSNATTEEPIKSEQFVKPTSNNTDDMATSESMAGGARGMNPGFKAFIDLKKKIAEALGIPNGPKAAKIAGSIQKEMKEKYADLTSVQLAAKGLEHFKKDPSKYKKMV
jgi:hypothetical protein